VKSRGALARVFARLSGRQHLEQLAALDEKISKFARAQREELSAQRRQLDQITSELSAKAGAEAVRDLRRQLDDLETSLTQDERDARIIHRLEQLERHDRPIIVGPWTGEVGFELLYWIPFVRWAIDRYKLAPERLLIVSRGGAAPWYEGIAGRYADALSYFSADEFRAATVDAKKQRTVGSFDARLVERVVEAHRLEHPALLHPRMMYRLFTPFWKDLAPLGRIDAHTKYERLNDIADPALNDLPSDYIAARFYFNVCFPDSPANRAFVTSTIDAISRQTPVVLLNTPFAVDEHRDFVPSGGRVHTLGRHMVPERNLAVQTAVIARARAFVGNYGGYSYLAPFCGVNSLAFYTEKSFKDQHLHVAQRVFERLGTAALVPLDVASVPLVRLAMDRAFAVAP
jgi:hypothetical protein